MSVNAGRRGRAALAAWAAAALAASGCAIPITERVEIPGEDPLAGYTRLSGVVLPSGSKVYDCGPEAITAVLHYRGDPVPVDEAIAALYRPNLEGTLSPQLSVYARSRGFPTKLRKGTLDALRQSIREGHPPIVMINVARGPKALIYASRAQGYYHFLVVTGFNDDERRVVCAGYEGRHWLIDYDVLTGAWVDAGYFMLQVLPRSARLAEESEGKQ